MRRVHVGSRLLELVLGALIGAVALLALTTADRRYAYPDFCSIHQASMHTGIVPIQYGMLQLAPIGTASTSSNANLSHPGGCVVTSRFLAVVNYCEHCRRAAQQVPDRDA